MPSTPLKKERWTLTFDKRLKQVIIAEAQQRGVYPVQILEELVREKFNPFGHTDVTDPVAYVRALRRKSRGMTDEAFLTDLKRWERVTS